MKITRTDLVLYTLAALATWMPSLPLLEEVFSYAAGRAAAIYVILYAHSQYGTKIALLLVLLYMRYASSTTTTGFWEHMSMPDTGNCTCKAGELFDKDTKMCKGKNDMFTPPVSCNCPSGYEYDTQEGNCKERTLVDSVPVSNMPVTTPGEALAMAMTPRPAMPGASAGPTPMDRAQPTTAPV